MSELIDKVYFEDVNEGDEVPPFSVSPVTRTIIVKYAGAGGDFSPMHHDELHAIRTGADRIFAHGLLGAGFMGTTLEKWLGVALRGRQVYSLMRVILKVVQLIEVKAIVNVLPLVGEAGALGVVQLNPIELKVHLVSPVRGLALCDQRGDALARHVSGHITSGDVAERLRHVRLACEGVNHAPRLL